MIQIVMLIAMQNATERAASAGTRDDIAGIEREHLRDLPGARSRIGLPLPEDVDREPDQFGSTERAGLANDRPQPGRGLQNVQRRVDATIRIVLAGRNVAGVVIEAHHIFDRTRDPVAVAVVRVGVRALDHTRDRTQRLLVVDVAIAGTTTLDDGYADSMSSLCWRLVERL